MLENPNSRRAAHWYLLRERFGWLLLLAGFLLGGGLIVLIATLGIEPKTQDGFVRADVLFTNSYATDTSGFRHTAIVRLPDGSTAHVTTKSVALSATVTDTVCLSRRRGDSGKHYYRIAQPNLCKQ